MNIYWIGCEDIDFIHGTGGVPDWYATTTVFHPGYNRGAMKLYAGANSSFPNGARWRGKTWPSPLSEFWLTVRLGFDSLSYIPNGAILLHFYDGATLRLMIRTSSTQVQIYKRTAGGTGTSLQIENITWAPGKYDVHVVYGTSGSVTFYKNGVQAVTYSGDVTTDSATTLDSVALGGMNSLNGTYFYECIVSDSDTREMAVVTLNSATAGNTQNWTGTPSNVNQGTSNGLTNDGVYIYSSTADQIEQFKVGPTPPVEFNVLAMVSSARVLVGATGPQKFAFVPRVGSTDYATSDVTPTTSFANYQNVWHLNPASSLSWKQSEIVASNLQYGIKSRA